MGGEVGGEASDVLGCLECNSEILSWVIWCEVIIGDLVRQERVYDSTERQSI